MKKISLFSLVFFLSACGLTGSPAISEKTPMTPENTEATMPAPTSENKQENDLPAPVDESGVEGKVFLGPQCPVARADTPCPDKPYQATLTINKADDTFVTQVETDESGYFRVLLAPGEYILHPEFQGRSPRAPEQQFTVQTGRITFLTVSYDNGMR